MATWILTAASLPLSSAPNGDLEGDIQLSGAMPIDFDPDGIAEIRLARTLTVSNVTDDTVSDAQSIQLRNSDGQSVASFWGTSVNYTTSGSWEFSRAFPAPFAAAPTSGGNYLTPPTGFWSTYLAIKKPDSGVSSITAITCEIDYVPLTPEPPTVSVSASDTEVLTDDIVTFTVTRTGKPTPALTWQHDGVQYGSTSDPLVRQIYWTTPGTRTATVTATNNSGSAQDSVQIVVAAPPLQAPSAILSITSTGPYEPGVTPVQAAFMFSNPQVPFESGAAATATLNWGDGSTDDVAPYDSDSAGWIPSAFSHIYTAAGTFTITLTIERTVVDPASAQDAKQVTITEPEPPPPTVPISELKDDFSGGYAGKWPDSYGSIVTADGEAVIQRSDPAGYSALWTSPNTYDARNGEFVMRMRVPGVGSGGREFSVELRIDNNNYVQFYCIGYPSTLSAVLRQGGAFSYAGQVALPADTVWVKFSISNSVVTYSYSTDRINWTVLGTATPTFSLNGITVHMVGGAWQSEGAFDVGYAYVNTVPPGESVVPGKIWNGTSWQAPKIWNGTRWVTGPEAKVWNGTAWVPMGVVDTTPVPTTTFWRSFNGGAVGTVIGTEDNGDGMPFSTTGGTQQVYAAGGRGDTVAAKYRGGATGTGIVQWNNPTPLTKAAVGFWYQPGRVPTIDARLFDLRNTPSAGTVGGVLLTTSTPRFRIMDLSSGLSAGQSPAITIGQWYWVSLGWDQAAKTARLVVHNSDLSAFHDSGVVALTLTTAADLTTARFIRSVTFDDGGGLLDDLQFNVGDNTPLPPWGTAATVAPPVAGISGPSSTSSYGNFTWNSTSTGDITSYYWQMLDSNKVPTYGGFTPVVGTEASFTTTYGPGYSGTAFVRLTVTGAGGQSVVDHQFNATAGAPD